MIRILSYSGLASILILFHVVSSKAQITSLSEFAMGTRSTALGQTASTSFSDALASSSNPANSINAQKITVSVFYSTQEPKTDYTSFGVIIPTTRNGTFGLSYYQVSSEYSLFTANYIDVLFNTFNQKHFMLTYARSVFRTIAIGINAKYIIQSYGKTEDETDYFGIDIGIQYQPNVTSRLFQNSSIGISIDNIIEPMGPFLKNEDLLREYRFIAEKNIVFGNNTFHMIANLVTKEEYSHKNENSIELKKKLSRLKVLFGVEYAWKNLFFRIGRGPNSISGGLGIEIGSFNFGYSYGSLGFESLLANCYSISYEY